MRVALRGRFRGVQEPLVAHVAFTAAEENIGTLLPLHTLVTVVAVDIIQPASLLDNLHSPGDIFPCGETVPPLVFLAIAGFDAAAVSPLLLPAGVVVGALLRL